MTRSVFKRVASLSPGRSVFDLSYEKKFTCDMGQLIPVMCDEVVPGDFWKIGNQSIIRFQPLVSPVLHEIMQYVHYFFVPYRLLWDDWETFITGGQDGDDATPMIEWNPTDTSAGSLWDFMGFPVGVNPGATARPVDFPKRAYNLIWNEYYRSEDLQAEIDITTSEDILNRCWEKDYFTSSLPFQQRGTAPALPISGTDVTSAVWPAGAFGVGRYSSVDAQGTAGFPILYGAAAANQTNIQNMFNSNTVTVDFSGATTYDIADLRLAFQIQKWMERNARAGVRYVEFLGAHFGVHPRDERLQRPEYIGGSKAPVIISEVLQTSETAGTPQGNLAGHGICISDAYCGKYHATEFGLIMGIMSVMPRPAYQEGINRQWLKQTRYDFYFPEFANLSEQAVLNNEIYSTDADPTTNNGIFGYQGRYDEMRIKQNMIVSELRDTFDYWHMGRIFGALPDLNDVFVECIPTKRIFADELDPGLIVSFGNLIKAYRPIPIQSNPGLTDHH